MSSTAACRLLLGILLTVVAACDPAPTPSPAPVLPTLLPSDQQISMYTAVADAFFAAHIHDLLHPNLLSTPVAYIQPTFSGTHDPLPPAVLALLVAHAQALGLTPVSQEQKGGLVVRVTTIQRDPQKAPPDHPTAPTIGMAGGVNGNECATYETVGYWLAPAGSGWKAIMYSMGEC